MIQFTFITKQSNGWFFTWTTTGAPSYRVVLNGILLDVVTSPSYLFTLQAINYQKYPPPLEVVEEGSLALSEIYSPILLMQWYQEDCSYYLLSELTGAGLVKSSSINEVGANWVYSIQTQPLQDESVHTYRLQSFGRSGQVSPDQDFTITVVCPPKWVDDSVTITYNKATSKIVVAVP